MKTQNCESPAFLVGNTGLDGLILLAGEAFRGEVVLDDMGLTRMPTPPATPPPRERKSLPPPVRTGVADKGKPDAPEDAAAAAAIAARRV